MDRRETAFDPFDRYGWVDMNNMIGFIWTEYVPDETKVVGARVFHDDDGARWAAPIRCHMEVCDVCEGRGTHVNPSIDSHGLTYEDFASDPDFADDYFSGVYDVICYQCKGKNVMLAPDENDPNAHIYFHLIEQHWEYMAECEAERRMGA